MEAQLEIGSFSPVRYARILLSHVLPAWKRAVSIRERLRLSYNPLQFHLRTLGQMSDTTVKQIVSL